MNEAEVVTATREILADGSRWAKGVLESDDGSRMCLLGALDRAGRGKLWFSDPARDGAVSVIEAHLPGGAAAWMGQYLDPIAAFNDDPATSHEDVLTLLDKTLADLGALGDER